MSTRGETSSSKDDEKAIPPTPTTATATARAATSTISATPPAEPERTGWTRTSASGSAHRRPFLNKTQARPKQKQDAPGPLWPRRVVKLAASRWLGSLPAQERSCQHHIGHSNFGLGPRRLLALRLVADSGQLRFLRAAFMRPKHDEAHGLGAVLGEPEP
jgi:hypothetical protein